MTDMVVAINFRNTFLLFTSECILSQTIHHMKIYTAMHHCKISSSYLYYKVQSCNASVITIQAIISLQRYEIYNNGLKCAANHIRKNVSIASGTYYGFLSVLTCNRHIHGYVGASMHTHRCKLWRPK